MKLKIALAALACFGIAQAQTEFINTDFGTDGVACIYMGPQTLIMGDLIKVNEDYYGISSLSEYNLVKLSPDGSLYPSFGENGYVPLNLATFGGELGDYNNAFIKQLPNNNLLMAVDVSSMAGYDKFITCTDLDGNLVESFGTNGYVHFISPDNVDFLSVEVIGNEIIAIGQGMEISDTFDVLNYILIMKYDLDGNLIPTFGNNGIYQFYLDEGTTPENVAYVPSQNAVYLLVQIDSPDIGIYRAIFKYNTQTNAASTDFGTGGYLNFYIEPNIDLMPNTLFADENSMIIAGTKLAEGLEKHVFIKKFATDGTPDTSFGTDGSGSVVYDLPGEGMLQTCTMNLTEQYIILSGYTHVSNGGEELFVVKATSEGTIDTTFGNGGHILTVGNLGASLVAPYKLIEEEEWLTVATFSNVCSQGNQSSPAVLQFLNNTTTGTDTQNIAGPLLYPNPVKDHLYFSNVQTIENGVIYDVSGKQVCTVPTGTTTANLSALKSGVYIFKAVVNGEALNAKIIKE